MEGIVLPIGDDDVVEEFDVHHFAGTVEVPCQYLIVVAGGEITRGMVVTDGEDSAVREDGLPHDDADVDGGFCDTAMRDANFLDETVVLVHQQCPELLDVKILHDRVHVIVDTGGSAEVWELFGSFSLSALAQFTGRKDADGLCLADTIILEKVVDGHLPQRVQVVVAVGEYPFHKINGALFL